MSESEKKLPVAGAQAPSGEAPRPEVDEVPSWRLISTLAIAGALAGLLIVSVFRWAEPQILAYRAEVLSGAIQEVLGGPDRYETLFLQDGRFVREVPAGTDTMAIRKVYRGYDADGRAIGYAIVGAQPGFQDVIQLIFGYEPTSDRVLGMRVLESKETPGLGDKIMKDQGFVDEFAGVGAPIRGVKEGAGAGSDDEVDMITGATISSRTVIEIINEAVEELEPLLTSFEAGAATAGPAGDAVAAPRSGPASPDGGAP